MNEPLEASFPRWNPSEAPGLRILLVDEDITDLKHYFKILDQAGHFVLACASHTSATQLLEKTAFDFVVVSQGGPEFEGHAVLERLLDRAPRIPALVLTKCADMRAYIEAMQMGAVDYLEKPTDASELARIIRAHAPPVRVPAPLVQRAAG